MKPDIDTIVKEIIEQNPELELETSVLRSLVTEMITKQPLVQIDSAFRSRLRTQLLASLPKRKSTSSVLPWWLIYTVPVGVTVVLLLVIQPSQTSGPVLPTDSASYDAVPALMDREGTASKRSAEITDPDTSAGFAEDMVQYQTPTTNNDFFTVAFTADLASLRVAYASLSVPAILHVVGPQGEVVVSSLVQSGEQTNQELPLIAPVIRGLTYTATLYYDNGDGEFSAVDDIPARDASGSPLMMTLVP